MFPLPSKSVLLLFRPVRHGAIIQIVNWRGLVPVGTYSHSLVENKLSQRWAIFPRFCSLVIVLESTPRDIGSLQESDTVVIYFQPKS
jgi:hypothetical protein